MSKLQLVGMAGALIFLIIAWATLGWIKMILFAIFVGLAIQDAMTSKVNAAVFLPIGILLIIFFPLAMLQIFAPIFGILLGLWAFIGLLQEKTQLLDKEVVYFGFGDVLGLPFAVTLSQVFIPVLGLAAFAAGALLVMPWFMKKKQRRFLPWLLPGVFLAFLTAMVFL